MQDWKHASTPMEKGLKLTAKSISLVVNESAFRQLVGSLIYLTATRPGLSFAVNYISRFLTAPKVDHWVAVKHVLRYVKDTSHFGLMYSRSHNPRLVGFTDSNWASFVDDKKSTSGYVFSLGSSAITWTSKKQHAMALSSTKAEYRGTVKNL
ncbi:secreted RxLR effector protein 161-like [Cryptomeria japonica]|uniref:secreted RxLR effector protein 161-like n=1 Tax=Cryptomeria japonica TaxID=3369 RepID=UPI0027D9D0E6|nr:secreted RxLR effector protein 161-like [Cryptomeria japonica]